MLKYFSFKELTKEINGYGFQFSLKKYLTALIGVVLATIGAGIFYELHIVPLLIVGLFAVGCMPAIIRAQFIFMYKQRRFNDVDVYLHQMVYSFQKTARIIIALEDTYRVSEGELKAAVGAALNEFSVNVNSTVMEDALKHIEDVYPTEKVQTLHKYLISIEKRGGKYYESLQVLLGDFNRWVKRIYKRQEDLKYMKRDAMIGVLITFFVGSATVLVTKIMGGADAGIDMSISGNILYQAGSVAFFILCFIYYTYIQVHYTGEWLGKVRTDEEILKDLEIVNNEDYVRSVRMKGIPIYIIFLIIGIALLVIGGTVFNVAGAIVLLFVCIMLITPDTDRKAAVKRINNDVYDAFSVWMRDVAINLQHEPLQAAIEETYNDCPVIMKDTLAKFIVETRQNPTAVEPYAGLMSEFNILDISSAVKSLYAFSELDMEDDVDVTVGAIIERNYELLDEREEKADKDAASMREMMHYIPSFFIAMKVMIDMVLILTTYL